MSKFQIEAMLIKGYRVEVEAVDEEDAMRQIEDWIVDDFEPYETNAQWEFEVIEVE